MRDFLPIRPLASAFHLLHRVLPCFSCLVTSKRNQENNGSKTSEPLQMAWRPGAWVLDGELDNTTLRWTTGWIRLQGRDEPLRLKLAGNCHPDLAGWKIKVIRTRRCHA